MILFTGAHQIFLVAVNGADVVKVAQMGTAQLILQKPDSPIPSDPADSQSPKSGTSVHQVDVTTILKSRSFELHRTARDEQNNSHSHSHNVTMMLDARNKLEDNGLLVFQDSNYTMQCDDDHSTRTFYLLAFNFISVDQVIAIAKKHNREIKSFDVYDILLQAVQKLDRKLDEKQPPWIDASQWSEEVIIRMIESYLSET